MSDIICWWSGGITSAVACKKAIDIYGNNRCRVIMIDTKNEDEDTYRFKQDCEEWYSQKIEVITVLGDKYKNIQDVWRQHKSLNVATGAICSSVLKKGAREKWEKENNYSNQVFGFEFDKKEFNRALSLAMNHPRTKPLFPLLMLGLNKEDCLVLVKEAGIQVPRSYMLGFNNNNCLKTGCVQGGVGYWQKMKRDKPDLFNAMASMEHELTELRGRPVTMLKDQSKTAKTSGNILVFLKKNDKYPQLKCIDEMKGREPKPLTDCNGFCGTNDFADKSNPTELEINYDFMEDVP